MKIEVGKTYITASGEKAGPMVNQHHANLFVEEKENLISPYFHIRQSWNRDGTVCHSTAEDTPHTLVAEYVAPLVVEIGKKYVTKDGSIVGPMTQEKNIKEWLTCESTTVMQKYAPRTPQVWHSNGKVADMSEGEEGHEIVAEYVEPVAKLKITSGGTYMTRDGRKVTLSEYEGRSFTFAGCVERDEKQGKRVYQKDGTHGSQFIPNVPGLDIVAEYDPSADKRGATPRTDAVLSGVEEIKRLNAVIEGLTGKLQRVQNIHAHTIKTVRKARAQVRKVNAALSEEQRKNGALRNRLAEVARAVGEASEYVAKVSKPVVDIDVSKVNILERESIKDAIKGVHSALGRAFEWDSTTHGHSYWLARYFGNEKLVSADYKFLKALLDR